MDLIVDANIIFATLIKDGMTMAIITELKIHLFAPEFLLDEVLKYRKDIQKKTKRSNEQLNGLFESLKEKIDFIPMKEFEPSIKEAEKISPDEDDIPYLALALKLGIPLWSNDGALKEKQNRIKVYNTKDLLERGW